MTATDVRYPLEPLARAAGVALGVSGGHQADDAPSGMAALAEATGLSVATLKRYRNNGMTEEQADRVALALDQMPELVWPELWNAYTWDDHPPAARINAAKTTCPAGHPYDHIDAAGRRRCRTCRRSDLHRCRRKKRQKSRETQVGQVVSVHQPSLREAPT